MKKALKLNESGQGLTEYIILLLLVCVVSITTVKSLGSKVKSKLQEANRHIDKDLTLTDHSEHGGGSDGGGSD